MPEARKTANSRRFAGLRHEKIGCFAGCGGNSGGNFRLTTGSMGGDTRAVVIEFPVLLQRWCAFFNFALRLCGPLLPPGRFTTPAKMQELEWYLESAGPAD